MHSEGYGPSFLHHIKQYVMCYAAKYVEIYFSVICGQINSIDPHLLRLSAYYKVYSLNYYIGNLNNIKSICLLSIQTGIMSTELNSLQKQFVAKGTSGKSQDPTSGATNNLFLLRATVHADELNRDVLLILYTAIESSRDRREQLKTRTQQHRGQIPPQ